MTEVELAELMADYQQAVDRSLKYEKALEAIAKKDPNKVGRAEAADMAVEFRIVARKALNLEV